MNRKLIATLLHKNVEELAMLSANFMEEASVSANIIGLAKRKTEDIQILLSEFEIASTKLVSETPPHEAFAMLNTASTSKKVDLNSQTQTEPASAQAVEPVGIVTSTPPQTYLLEEMLATDQVIKTATNTQNANELHRVKPNEVATPPKSEKPAEQQGLANTELPTTASNDTPNEANTPAIKKTIAETIGGQTTSRNESLQSKDQLLNASLSSSKVTDIKQAISIGDRFRFQRELFNSNGEDMNKTLTYINLLQSYDEAITFLKSKYNWTEPNEVAEDFYQVLKRKFA